MPVLFPHAPERMIERPRFITDIRRTATGEWRDALKDGDYILEMAWKLPSAQAARLEGLFRSQPSGQWYVPLWQDHSLVTSTITSGTTVLTVDTNADYRVGGYVAVIHGDESSEVGQVQTVGVGSVTLTAGLGATYSGSVWDPVVICPVVTGYVPGGISRNDKDQYSEFDAIFVCPDPVDLQAAAYATHLTYDVVTDESVLFASLDGEIARMVERIENGFGHLDLIDVEEYVRFRGTISAFDQTNAQRFARRQFIHRARGMDRPFWVSTWKNDLPLRATVASAATTARVQKVTPVLADYVNRSIQFLQPDGTLIQRQITGAVAVGGDPTSVDLTIAAPGQDVTTAAITSWLHLVRFATDEISIQHEQGNASINSRFSAPVVEVQA